MSEATQTPVVENTPLESQANASQAQSVPASQPKASPAQDLRDVQMLLVGGIFPGNMAPAVVKSYQMLEKMALEVENAAQK